MQMGLRRLPHFSKATRIYEMHGLTRVPSSFPEGHSRGETDQLRRSLKGCVDLAKYRLIDAGLEEDA